ncbi:MAG: FAD:protein FMN transferase [Pirellula sp.]|nr:FAD:protein FMN transferase [Pirellula sp.]
MRFGYHSSSTSTRREFLRRSVSIGGVAPLMLAFPTSVMALPAKDDEGGYRVSIPSMGSLIEIQWIGSESIQAKSVAQAASECADRWVDVLSDSQQDSECMQLCRQGVDGEWRAVSDALWRVMLECDRWHRLSEGAFDAALGALTRLRRSRKPFSESEWRDARARCGWEHVDLDREGHRVRLLRPGVMLDFGAIGKGFVVDRIGESLRSIGIDRFLVNASGNMLCGEAIETERGPQAEKSWPISIGTLGDPKLVLKQLRLKRCGIATSGDQFQKFRDAGSEEGAKPTSHILDPEKRRGLDAPNMATVITESASDADALATICCVHLQRGSLSSWKARVEAELPRAEYVLQSWRDRAIAYTSIPCDW